jgi:signal transduction histidine kinase/ActR/RegA family two-component response regulator
MKIRAAGHAGTQVVPVVRRLPQWWLDRSVLVKGLIVVAIPMLALIAVAGSALGLQSQESSERHAAISASALTTTSLTVLADATNAETGMRGYAATTNPVFLAPYTAAVAKIQPHLRAMQQAATAQREGTLGDAVAATMSNQLTRLAALAAIVRAGSSTSAIETSLTEGKVIFDRLRTQVAALSADSAAQVAQKRKAISRLENLIANVAWAGLALGVLAGLAGVALFTSGISRRVRDLADNASLLGGDEPLRASAPSADELGELGRSLTQAKVLLDSRMKHLATARDEAVLATRTKNTFLSRTSHELRTPLNAMLGFAQLLELADLSRDDRDSARRIVGAGRHLLGLINDLIDTALIEAGELRLSVEPVAVHGLSHDVASLIGPLASARAITVERAFPDARLAAFADDQRLRQVMLNLASNAVKYNHHGGVITIGYVLGSNNEIELFVADTGPGLTPEDIARIFLPFERLEAGQHGIEGSGIGLPLALGLTEAMHGTMDVISNPGIGSTFTLRLRRAPDIAPGPAEPDDPGATAVSGDLVSDQTLTVLSIEDNATNSEVLDRLFQRWANTSFHSAASGHAGIELASRHRPDLILLDMHLPDLPGEEVFARLRAEPATAHTPIIVLSADATPSTIRRLLARGASAYLTKPLDLAEFRQTIDEIVRTRAAAEPN